MGCVPAGQGGPQTLVEHPQPLLAMVPIDFTSAVIGVARFGLETASATTILKAPRGRRCLSLGRWSRSAVAQGSWCGRCCGRGSSLSERASAATAPEVLRVLSGCGLCLFLLRCISLCLCSPGASWAVVDSPSPDVGATHVAVGVSVVWVVTKDNKAGTGHRGPVPQTRFL